MSSDKPKPTQADWQKLSADLVCANEESQEILRRQFAERFDVGNPPPHSSTEKTESATAIRPGAGEENSMSTPTVGRIEQLSDIPGQPVQFFGEPMVGITVKQFDEYQALRARAAETCLWVMVEGVDGAYGGTCGDTYQWTGGDIHEVKFCPTCGRKVEVKP